MAWVSSTAKAWRNGVQSSANATVRVRPNTLSLELVGDDVVENKILSSRMALPVIEKVSGGFDDLRVRVQQLEGGSELVAGDILRPDVLVQSLVDRWVESGLDRIALLLDGHGRQGGLAGGRNRLRAGIHRAGQQQRAERQQGQAGSGWG